MVQQEHNPRGSGESVNERGKNNVNVFKDPVIIQFSSIYAPGCVLTEKSK